MLTNIEQEAAPAETGATDKGEASPSDIRFAEETARQMNELINGLANLPDPDGHLVHLRAQLTTHASTVQSAAQRRAPTAAMLASDAALFVTTHYATIMTAAGAGKEESKKQAHEQAAHAAIHAIEVAQTQHYLERTIDEFNGLSEPAKKYFAEDVQQMLDKEPVLKKAMDMAQDIENDPVLSGELDQMREQAQDAWLKLKQRAEQVNDSQMIEDLERMKKLMGKDKLVPAELIALNQKLESGEITYDDAKQQVQATLNKTERAVKGIYLKSYEHLSEEHKSIIAEHLGKKPGDKVTAEDLMKFMEDNKDKLTPERINEAFGRMQSGQATEEDKLVIAGASLKFKAEAGKGLYNVASHLLELQERDPDKYKEFMEKMQNKYEAKDLKGLISLMEEYGITNAEGITYEQQQFLAATVERLEFKDAAKVLALAQKGVTTGEDVSGQIRQIYLASMGQEAAKLGMDPTNLGSQQDALSMAFLQQVYHHPDIKVSEAEQPQSRYDLASIMSNARGWMSASDTTVAALDTDEITPPPATPSNDLVEALAASKTGTKSAIG